MLIYLVRNRLNGKVYVGKHQRVHLGSDFRWKSHWRSARNGSRTHFHNALRKYGRESFEFTILQSGIATRQELNDAERFYVAQFKSNDRRFGYNMTKGGDGGPGTTVCRPETREKIRLALKGKNTGRTPVKPFKKGHQINLGRMRPDLVIRMKAFHAAKSPEQRSAEARMMNLARSPEAREQARLKHVGRRASPATEIKKGQRLSPRTEFKKGLVPWNKGIPSVVSSEARAKISAKLKGRKKDPEVHRKMWVTRRARLREAT